MTVTIAKWTVEEYHRMIAAGILDDRHVELLQYVLSKKSLYTPPKFRKNLHQPVEGKNVG